VRWLRVPKLWYATGRGPARRSRAGIAGIFLVREAPSVCRDCVVELRGFEPMAIAGAARSRAIPLFASQGGATKARAAPDRG
jgi:hypothetical protein